MLLNIFSAVDIQEKLNNHKIENYEPISEQDQQNNKIDKRFFFIHAILFMIIVFWVTYPRDNVSKKGIVNTRTSADSKFESQSDDGSATSAVIKSDQHETLETYFDEFKFIKVYSNNPEKREEHFDNLTKALVEKDVFKDEPLTVHKINEGVEHAITNKKYSILQHIFNLCGNCCSFNSSVCILLSGINNYQDLAKKIVHKVTKEDTSIFSRNLVNLFFKVFLYAEAPFQFQYLLLLYYAHKNKLNLQQHKTIQDMIKEDMDIKCLIHYINGQHVDFVGEELPDFGDYQMFLVLWEEHFEYPCSNILLSFGNIEQVAHRYLYLPIEYANTLRSSIQLDEDFLKKIGQVEDLKTKKWLKYNSTLKNANAKDAIIKHIKETHQQLYHDLSSRQLSDLTQLRKKHNVKQSTMEKYLVNENDQAIFQNPKVIPQGMNFSKKEYEKLPLVKVNFLIEAVENFIKDSNNLLESDINLEKQNIICYFCNEEHNIYKINRECEARICPNNLISTLGIKNMDQYDHVLELISQTAIEDLHLDNEGHVQDTDTLCANKGLFYFCLKNYFSYKTQKKNISILECIILAMFDIDNNIPIHNDREYKIPYEKDDEIYMMAYDIENHTMTEKQVFAFGILNNKHWICCFRYNGNVYICDAGKIRQSTMKNVIKNHLNKIVMSKPCDEINAVKDDLYFAY